LAEPNPHKTTAIRTLSDRPRRRAARCAGSTSLLWPIEFPGRAFIGLGHPEQGLANHRNGAGLRPLSASTCLFPAIFGRQCPPPHSRNYAAATGLFLVRARARQLSRNGSAFRPALSEEPGNNRIGRAVPSPPESTDYSHLRANLIISQVIAPRQARGHDRVGNFNERG